MKRNTLFAVIYFCLALLCLMIFSPIKGSDNIYDSVIRIHVLANSDSQKDQTIKLRVRDCILQYAKESLPRAKDRDEAEVILREHLDEVHALTLRTLEEYQVGYEANVVLDKEEYRTREYESLRLPAGEYLSLRVQLGEAAGQNWWCVLFPPVCLNSSVKTEDALIDAGMNEENVKTVTVDKTEYRIKFKLVEWWHGTRQKISGLFS